MFEFILSVVEHRDLQSTPVPVISDTRYNIDLVISLVIHYRTYNNAFKAAGNGCGNDNIYYKL